MFNLSDILSSGQGAGAIDQMARQFGMAPDQVQSAMAALLPAFSMGLNRATQSPQDMAGLFGQFMGADHFTRMMEDPFAHTGAMMSAGQELIGQMFGSPQAAQAVAQHAAATSGIGEAILRQMMPVMASMIMSGLLRGAMSGQNPLGQVLGSVLSQLAPGAGAQNPAAANPFGPLVGMMTGMLGSLFGQSQPQPQPQTGIPGFDQMTEFVRKMQEAAQPASNAGEASGPRSVGQQAADTWTATMGPMFQHGRDIQEQQLAALEQVFAQFGPKR